MPNDIKQRIVLEGEKEYNAALKSAQRNLKTLRSELKAETAELGNNATAQQKAQVRAKNLQQQIREQEKAVKAHRDALEEVRKNYGDNADAIARYEQRLNDARTVLANLKNQLDAVGNSYDTVTSGAKQSIVENNALAESFQRIGDAAKSISGTIESVFSGMVNTIKGTIGAIYGELMDIAAKSDNYMDLASYFGASATEVQKWDNAMKGAAGDLSTVTGLITKLKYSGKDANVAEWFGVSAENYTNDLQYFQAVMQQMVDSRDEMIKAGTWDTAMADIFGGKKGMDVEGVLSDWEDILSGLDRFDVDKGGYGKTEDQIEQMARLNTQVATLKASWKELKEMATVHLFGDLAIKITGNLQNILDAFRDYMSADNPYAKKQALDAIKKNVREMFEAIRDAIKAGVEVLNELAEEFKNSDDPTSKTIGNVLQAIADTIAWLADPENWEKIKKGIMIVLGAWLFTKLAAVASALSGIVTSLGGIMGFRGGGLLGGKGGGAPVVTGGGAGGAGGAAATGGTAAAGGAAKTGFFAKIGASGALHGAAVAGGGLALIAGGVYALSEYVNAANARAAKEREVTRDENRYANLSNEEKVYLQKMVRDIQHETGGSENVAPMLEQLAGRMGSNLLDIFDYTNTSGQRRNKLVDMLSMDNESAAIAAMMLQAAGVDTSGMGSAYSTALGIWNDYQKAGKTSFTGAYTTLAGRGGFWDLSGNSNGLFTIPGISAPMVTGGPNPWELSGYANTTNKPTTLTNLAHGYWVGDEWRSPGMKTVNIDSGSWDPTRYSKVDISNDSVNGLKNAVRDGVSGIKVYMDKEIVGRLVAPTVSMQIAREVQ